uniref:Uncharacterized protein n=1 Tax=Melopsittacus undulatus TaxID=13146 RepID=A0A8V5FL93_MELUD
LNPLFFSFIMKPHGNSCKPIIYHSVSDCKETLQPELQYYSADLKKRHLTTKKTCKSHITL